MSVFRLKRERRDQPEYKHPVGRKHIRIGIVFGQIRGVSDQAVVHRVTRSNQEEQRINQIQEKRDTYENAIRPHDFEIAQLSNRNDLAACGRKESRSESMTKQEIF